MKPPEDVLADAVVALGRALRKSGIAAGVDDELVLCRALAEVDLRRREQVYWAARASFLRGRDEVEAFDRVFSRFWAGLVLDADVQAVAEHGEGDPRMSRPQHGGSSLPQFRSEGRAGDLLDTDAARISSALEIPATAGEEASKGERRGVLAAY